MEERKTVSFEAVVKENVARQKRARELNIRAGEDIFPVLDRAALAKWLKERLAGARSLAEIQTWENLILPGLDEDLVALVVQENPDAIEILGQEILVEYRSRSYGGSVYPPKATLPPGVLAYHKWLEIPDEGVRLPGGRLVEIVVSVNYTTISDYDVSRLKEKVKNTLNLEKWKNLETRPEMLPLPDPKDEGSEIPLIAIRYGECVVTGEELLAFGTLEPMVHRYGSNDPWFSRKWLSSRQEAEEIRSKAEAKLNELKAEARELLEREELKARVEDLRWELAGLSSREGWDDLDHGFRRSVKEKEYYVPFSLADLRQWLQSAEALKAEAEKALAKLAKQRAHRGAVRARLEEILSSQFANCPVCGGQLDRNSRHYCDREGQDSLHNWGEYGGLPLKRIRIQGLDLISLEAAYERRHNEFWVELRINEDILLEDPNAEIETELFWREPSTREREISLEIQELEQKISWIEKERNRSGRVEILFRGGKDPKGNFQLQGEGNFTGAVENRREESGWSQYENQPAIFICRPPCHWLEEQPEDDQTWICVCKFQVAIKGGKPVIVANPQVRSDSEPEIRKKIVEMEASLQKERVESRDKNENSGPLTGEKLSAGIEALRGKFGKK